MKLKAYVVAKNDDGTAGYEVGFMGKTYQVNPGQKEIAIDGVVFAIEGAEAPAKEAEPKTEKKTSKKK